MKELAEQNKKFKDKGEGQASISDQIIFDYSATVNGAKFDGSEGKGVKIQLGKIYF